MGLGTLPRCECHQCTQARAKMVLRPTAYVEYGVSSIPSDHYDYRTCWICERPISVNDSFGAQMDPYRRWHASHFPGGNK